MLTYNGKTLNAKGTLRGGPGEADLWWDGGKLVVLMNGRHKDPAQFRLPVGVGALMIDGRKCVNVDTLDPQNAAGAPIADGACRLFVREEDLPQIARALPQWYTRHGYPLAALPPQGLYEHTGEWGPIPDQRQTNAGGSGRLFASHVPGALACSFEFDRGASPNTGAMLLWVAQQFKRAVHFYDLEADGEGTEPTWWDCDTLPDYLPYQGYGSVHGGWSTLYGAKRPPGVTWSQSGWPCPDPDHFTLDQSALAAWLLDSDIVAAQARCLAETVTAIGRRELSTGGRGHGHVLRGLATFAMLDSDRAEKMLDDECARLESRNRAAVYDTVSEGVQVYDISAAQSLHASDPSRYKILAQVPVLDRANSTDSYHMPPSDTMWIAQVLGYSSDENRDLARSASSFMVGIIACGAALAYDAVEAYSTNNALARRLYAQMELAAGHLVSNARSPALNVSTRKFEGPTDGTMHDDYALPRFDLKVGLSKGGSKSVGPRFVAPALAAAYARTGHQQARAVALDVLSAYGAWGNWLECWPVGAL